MTNLEELRQRQWELEQAHEATAPLIARLEMARRPADVATVRSLRVALWSDAVDLAILILDRTPADDR